MAPNCAFCHQGSFRLRPDDPATLVPAGAGTRVNVQGFLRFLISSGGDARFTSDNVMTAITAIYDMPLWERLLYRYLLIPAVRSAFQDQAIRFAWMKPRPDCPRPDWGPGRIDPFNPVKFHNLGLPDDCTIGNSDIMPLWDLNRIAADPTRQYSLHWDGLSTSLRETAVAGAIGDGMNYQAFPDAKPALDVIIDFIRLQKPPPSPFSAARKADDPYHVDETEVAAGKALYQTHCADCHEPGGKRFRTLICTTALSRPCVIYWRPRLSGRESSTAAMTCSIRRAAVSPAKRALPPSVSGLCTTPLSPATATVGTSTAPVCPNKTSNGCWPS